jgi:hypothetical protein
VLNAEQLGRPAGGTIPEHLVGSELFLSHRVASLVAAS